MSRTDVIPKLTDKGRWLYANAARAEINYAYVKQFVAPKSGLQYADEQAVCGALLLHLSKYQTTYAKCELSASAFLQGTRINNAAHEAAKFLLKQASKYQLTGGEFAMLIGERSTSSSGYLMRSEREDEENTNEESSSDD